jgi:Domain of unknown function (DUF4410)
MHGALIGFGSGSAKMELYVTLSDLTSAQKPLYNAAQEDNSGKRPGAASTLNPYAAAAKFVMEKKCPEKNCEENRFSDFRSSRRTSQAVRTNLLGLNLMQRSDAPLNIREFQPNLHAAEV